MVAAVQVEGMEPARTPSAGMDAAPLTQLIGRFKDWLTARQFDPGHIARSCAVMQRLVTELGWQEPGDINRAAFLDLLTARVAKGLIASKTADNQVGQMGTFCSYLVESGHLEKSPITNVSKFARHTEVRGEGSRPATTEELRAIIAAAERDEAKPAPRFRVHRSMFYLFIAHTSLRYSAAQAITWGDLRLDENPPHLVLPASLEKARRRRDVPLTLELSAKLIARRSLIKPAATDRVFSFIHERVLRGDIEDAGVAKKTAEGPLGFHSFRKWCATTLSEQDVGIGMAAEVLGHADPKVTAQYYTRTKLAARAQAVAKLPTLNGVMRNPARAQDKCVDSGPELAEDVGVRSDLLNSNQPATGAVTCGATDLTIACAASAAPVAGLSSSPLSRAQVSEVAGVGFEPTTALGLAHHALSVVELALRVILRPLERAPKGAHREQLPPS